MYSGSYFCITVSNLVVWYATYHVVFVLGRSGWWILLGMVLTTRYPHEREE